MSRLRIVFMGTGQLARPVFDAIVQSPHEVVGLVTQPDRAGRGHHRHENPLKTLAEQRGMAVMQPEKIRLADSVAQLQSMNADLFVVAAYGQILSKQILDMPRLGTINVHASLLPKYRGATPIHAAVLNRDSESGVSIMRLEPKLDAGPVYAMVRTPIRPKETTGELEQRLSELAIPVTLEVIDQLADGTAQPIAQDESQATHVGKLAKADGAIPWEKSASELEAFCRGMQPWPGAFTFLHKSAATSLRLMVLDVDVDTGRDNSSKAPGDVVHVDRETLVVQCGVGAVTIRRLQPDGKRPMGIAEFLRGNTIAVGDRLGRLETPR